MVARGKTSPKRVAKLTVDAIMMMLLLLQMPQQQLGQGFHELSGIALGALIVAHNLLNLRWYAQLRRGRWTELRVIQTATNVCCLALLMLMLVSGIVMSELMSGLGVELPGVALMRRVHMVCVYASLIAMSFHLGLHWRMVLGLFRSSGRSSNSLRFVSVIVRLATIAVSAYGVYAFVKLNLWGYLSGGVEYAFMDTSVPLPVFLADYVAVMVMAACVGHYSAKFLGKRWRTVAQKSKNQPTLPHTNAAFAAIAVVSAFSLLTSCSGSGETALLSGAEQSEPSPAAQQNSKTDDPLQEQAMRFTQNSTVSEVVSDPAFGDWGRLLFPVHDGYWRGDTLGDLDFTWYSHVSPDDSVEVVNYLYDRAQAGEQVFFDLYTDEEKAADPAKADTGLVFFKGEPGGRFAICNAGGGFSYVAAMHDSFPHALELSKRGYNAFALVYRPGAQTACEDLARAISFVFEHADELGVDTDCYSLWGGSAGGRMAAWLGSYGTAAFGGGDVPQAGCVVMQYTGLSEHQPTDPPTYACVGTSDGIASWQVMERRIDGMAAAGIPTEFHAYEGLGHGFGLGRGTVAEGWLDDAVSFWEQQMEG